MLDEGVLPNFSYDLDFASEPPRFSATAPCQSFSSSLSNPIQNPFLIAPKGMSKGIEMGVEKG
ncbi:hypothetical protein GQF61_16650 [Sphingobacterium sp. DK4209]|uniref:Uncharacterized protein n=1 Tax=Sphingobacterium zhuxiongii TaxID=2662364 RepID=A0A5Q0QI93_9SPHI|nr:MULTISPECIES: hypothetical protein [unclassified Sphingobacterium]MVZ67484.1 hypothetical protein [Sphingobacterium sp. DK4209]QGA27230.1 hypothetical protein GFH32_13330 [Sphingobacterium sp. dk4302]